VTKPHQAFEACRNSARDRGARVTGSELVGLVPEGDLLAAGRYFQEQAGQSPGLPRRQLLETAVQSLGLRDLGPFDAAERIIEYRAGLVDGPLVSMTNRAFLDELSTDSPAPGGGSVAALGCAQAAALVAMVANLTVGKKKYDAVQDRVKAVAVRGQDLKDRFLAAMDHDTDAFNAVMASFGLAKGTPDQARERDLAIAAATREATRVPLSVLQAVPELLDLAAEIAEIGNAPSLSDAGVAVLMAMAGAEGAYYNVIINLESLRGLDQSAEPSFAGETLAAARATLADCEQRAAAARAAVRGRLESALDA
jgi:glutamate formiminotransferase/formiminotetrahydrofolate cyclodeaminase